MTLVIDIGNSNIFGGIYCDSVLIWHFRLMTDTMRTADEYFALLKSMKTESWNADSISCVGVASVVPIVTRVWQHLTRKYFNLEAVLISGYSELGITYNVSDPGFIGADLIANAYGAWKKYAADCIIIDLGTATTIQVITKFGQFLGAIIAPGIKTASSNLTQKAALLNDVELTQPPTLLGSTTKDALLSGIVTGHAIMLEGFIRALKEKYIDLKLSVILTGGISDLIEPLIKSIDHVDKTLTLDGIYMASRSNSQIHGAF
jgi:type III pantothenate kinase